MENKIEKLNKNIEQFKVEVTQKDKIMAKIKNSNNDLLAKMVKQKVEHDKNIQELKDELENKKKQVVESKSQTNATDK